MTNVKGHKGIRSGVTAPVALNLGARRQHRAALVGRFATCQTAAYTHSIKGWGGGANTVWTLESES